MKTEFNVERVCERVHLCIVDSPEILGAALIEIRNGSVHVSFPRCDSRLGQIAARLERIEAAIPDEPVIREKMEAVWKAAASSENGQQPTWIHSAEHGLVITDESPIAALVNAEPVSSPFEGMYAIGAIGHPDFDAANRSRTAEMRGMLDAAVADPTPATPPEAPTKPRKRGK